VRDIKGEKGKGRGEGEEEREERIKIRRYAELNSLSAFSPSQGDTIGYAKYKFIH
jgi:hypothetical protein